MASHAGDATAPWYRRRLTPWQHGAVIFGTLALGAVVAALVFTHRVSVGRLAEQHPLAAVLVRLGLTSLQGLAAWVVAGQATRLAPYVGLFMAACFGLAAAYGNTVSMVAVAALLAVALAARPRPHRRVIRVCTGLMVCLLVAFDAWRLF